MRFEAKDSVILGAEGSSDGFGGEVVHRKIIFPNEHHSKLLRSLRRNISIYLFLSVSHICS